MTCATYAQPFTLHSLNWFCTGTHIPLLLCLHPPWPVRHCIPRALQHTNLRVWLWWHIQNSTTNPIICSGKSKSHSTSCLSDRHFYWRLDSLCHELMVALTFFKISLATPSLSLGPAFLAENSGTLPSWRSSLHACAARCLSMWRCISTTCTLWIPLLEELLLQHFRDLLQGVIPGGPCHRLLSDSSTSVINRPDNISAASAPHLTPLHLLSTVVAIFPYDLWVRFSVFLCLEIQLPVNMMFF